MDVDSLEPKIYIYIFMFVTCLAFTNRNFEKRIFERRKSAIGSKNNRNLPRVNKCDIILYIYICISVCLSVYIHWRSWHFQKFIRRNDLCSMLISVRSLLRRCCLSAQYSFRLCASLRHPISFDKIERNDTIGEKEKKKF